MNPRREFFGQALAAIGVCTPGLPLTGLAASVAERQGLDESQAKAMLGECARLMECIGLRPRYAYQLCEAAGISKERAAAFFAEAEAELRRAQDDVTVNHCYGRVFRGMGDPQYEMERALSYVGGDDPFSDRSPTQQHELGIRLVDAIQRGIRDRKEWLVGLRRAEAADKAN